MHTKGTWKVCKRRGGLSIKSGDTTVASIIRTSGATEVEKMCNAYLIAAAPDALKILERIERDLTWIMRMGFVDNPGGTGVVSGIIVDARQIIAEMKGE